MVGNTAHPLATASEIISNPTRLASLSHRRIHARSTAASVNGKYPGVQPATASLQDPILFLSSGRQA